MPSSGRGLSRILYSWYVRCILDYVLEGLAYFIHAHNWFIGGQGNRRGVSVGATRTVPALVIEMIHRAEGTL